MAIIAMNEPQVEEPVLTMLAEPPNVFPAGKGFDLAGDVDSCHLASTSGELDAKIDARRAEGKLTLTNKRIMADGPVSRILCGVLT